MSYLGFSYLGHGVSLHGCSSKAQSPLLTLEERCLLTATLPDFERGVAPLGPPVPAQPLEYNGDLLQNFPCMHCCTLCPNSVAGHHQLIPLLETPGHSQTSLKQSLVGSLLLCPVFWCTQGFVCALQESVSHSCVNSGGINDDLLQEGLYHTQIYCTQSPYLCSSPLLTCTSTGDTQTQFWLSLCRISGSWHTEDLFEPSEHLW